MDERLVVLLKQRSVRCNINKSHPLLRGWFIENVKLYNILWARPDNGVQPLKSILDYFFTLLKFIALKNNKGRKLDLLERKWPALKERIDAL